MLKYTYAEHKHAHGVNKYKITELGTAYHVDTPDKLVMLMETWRQYNNRITFHYGADGKEWGDKESCTIGRSTGTIKVPLAIKTVRSHGGGAILTHCVARVTAGKLTLYQV